MKNARSLTFKVHHADNTVANDQRHSHFGSNIGVRGNVSRIGQSVVDTNDFPLHRRSSRDALAERDVVEIDPLVVSFAEAMTKTAALRIHQQDAEGIIVDQRAHRLGNLRREVRSSCRIDENSVESCARMRDVRF